MALTTSVSLSSKTETTITMKWSANATIIQVKHRHKAGSGSWSAWTTMPVNAKSGSYKITGLSAYTSYTIETDIASSSEGTVSTNTVKTYNWPSAKPGDFSVKSRVAPITFYNPVGRSVTVEYYANGQLFMTETGSTTHGEEDLSIFPEDFLEACTDALTAEWSIKVTYSSHVKTNTATYDMSGYNPMITSATYADTNSTAQAIIQDTTKLLQNISTPRVTVSGTAQYSATLARADVVILNTPATGTASGGTATVDCAPVNSATNVSALVVLYDSRGNRSSTTLTLQMIGYEPPSAIVELARQNNFYSETDLTVDASVASLGTNVPTITAKYRETGTGTWYNWAGQATLSDNTLYTQSIDNTKAWDVQVIVADSIGGSTTYNLSVGVGLPILFLDRLLRSIGVNAFPTEAGEVAVGGRINPEQLTIAGAIDGSDSILTVSLSSGTSIQNIGSFELTKGTWDVHVYCRFTSNAVGRRLITIANTQTGNDGKDWDRISANAVDGTFTYLHLHTWLTVTGATKTFYVNGYQNSGTSLQVLTRWGAVRMSTT